jgi:acylphosphatase
MSKKKIQVKAIISGRVQGVFYRAETKKAADKFGIQGYVKNMPNGSVEAVFEGDNSIVEKMLNWCKEGPPAARVENILSEKLEALSNFEAFLIQY